MIKKILLILVLGVFGLAANKKDDSAQSKEIIEIAQNLILQKDRDQAIRILNKAVQTEKNKALLGEIKSILKEIGSLFLYDKSQQEFEFSVNFKKTDPSKWLITVEKAQKIEPDNTVIMVELVRNFINQKKLEKAREVVEEFRHKNALDKNVVLASLFLAVAGSDQKEIQSAKLKVKELHMPNHNLILSYIEFLEKYKFGDREKKALAFAAFKKEDPQNPQIPYWENKLNGKAVEEDSICISVPEPYYRRYLHDLFFCSPALEYFFKNVPKQ